MKKTLILCVVLVLVCLLGSAAACSLTNTSDGEAPSLKLAVEGENAPTTKLPTKKAVVLKVSTNIEYTPEELRFELVTNTCEATLTVENGVASISALKSGDVSVKAKIVREEAVVVESEAFALNFLKNDINTLDEFIGLKDKTEGYYVLNSDLDFTNVTWTPFELKCHLDGNGHSLLNFRYEDISAGTQGLFSVITGSVSNLTIDNAYVSAFGDKRDIGILAGCNRGVVDNVTVRGEISAPYMATVGGIIGFNDFGIVKNCKNYATVLGKEHTAGIVGYAHINGNNQIQDNVNEGEITGTNDNTGGVIGYLTPVMSEATYKLDGNTNNATINGNNDVGGLIGEVHAYYGEDRYGGYTNHVDITNFVNNGPVIAKGDRVGGIIGRGSNVSTMTVCANNADIKGVNFVGAWVGDSPFTHIQAGGTENVNTITGNGYVGGFAGVAGVIEQAINSGSIVSEMPIIENEDNRAYIGGIAGHCTGLIGCTNNSDITLIHKGRYAGGLCGYVRVREDDKFNDNVNNGVIKGYKHVGGIAGYVTPIMSNHTYNVSNNTNKGAIEGHEYVGGIAGSLWGFYGEDRYGGYSCYFNVTKFYNQGVVTAKSDRAGGLVAHGQYVKKMTLCNNTADITGDNYVGGWIGEIPEVNIVAQGVDNKNTIKGNGYVGGYAGYAGVIEGAVNNGTVQSMTAMLDGTTQNAYVGGIAGYCRGLNNCTNNSDVTIPHKGKYVGGLAGYIKIADDNKFNDNANNGVITGHDYVGGIVGRLNTYKTNHTFKVADDINNGAVNGDNYVGGIAGMIYGYYDSDRYGGYYSYFDADAMKNTAVITATKDQVGGIFGASHYLSQLSMSENLADITGNNYVGGLLGYSPDTKIQQLNGVNTNTITGNAHVGGFAGEAGIVEGCTNNGTVIATGYATYNNEPYIYMGGVAGYCTGLIDCYNTQDISLSQIGRYVGGIAGYVKLSKDNIHNNENNGIVNAPNASRVGGVAGTITCVTSNTTYNVTENSNFSDVTGLDRVGGVVGEVWGFYAEDRYGGYTSRFILMNNNNNANIVGSTAHVGGIVGFQQNMKLDAVYMDTNQDTSSKKVGNA